MNKSELRCLLVSDFTIDALSGFLGGDEPVIHAEIAPYNQVHPILIDDTAQCWKDPNDLLVVWTQPASAIPSFGRLLANETVQIDEIIAEVDEFASLLRGAANRVTSVFVPSWTSPYYDRGLGMLNMDPALGPAYHLMKMNVHLAEAIADCNNIFVLDAQRWMTANGQESTNPKLWLLGKIAFGPKVLSLAAEELRAAVCALAGKARKLIVVDLDDTLWGGIVGEIGWENLKLGGHDAVGEGFVDFQKALRTLNNRGVVLGIVSKNTEAIALEAIAKNPEMVLGQDDFAGWRINWGDKAQNIADLAVELNLGLDSIVFIDDSPAERARVREALPMVLVPEWPANSLLYRRALLELACFDTPGISTEDRKRTKMYVSERQRSTIRKEVRSFDEWLASLDLKIEVCRLSAADLSRATQLLNKTNQLNLSTRRMTEAEYMTWAEEPDNVVLTYRVSDRFGSYGLTGIAGLRADGRNGRIEDFVLSCRVMGRCVELTMLHSLAVAARTMGLTEITATYLETARNTPCHTFFEEQSGFSKLEDGTTYQWNLDVNYPQPEHVEVIGLPEAEQSLAGQRVTEAGSPG